MLVMMKEMSYIFLIYIIKETNTYIVNKRLKIGFVIKLFVNIKFKKL